MRSPGVFGGETRLVLESVGTADAAALRAIRQLVPGAIQHVARLVYQAPSELSTGLRADAAVQVQQLLEGLGFRISVAPSSADFHAGVGEFEIALVIGDVQQLPLVIAEAAAFLGADLPTARRLVCRSPAVLVSNVSDATVCAVRTRFARLHVDIDVSRSSTARYYAVIAVDNLAVRRMVHDIVRAMAGDARLVETPEALVVEDLGLAAAQELWERLRRTGARASIGNRDLERYDVSLTRAEPTAAISEVLESSGVPARVVPRVLKALPVVIRQNVGDAAMQTLLDRVAAAGGLAIGLPHSFQRFALVLRSIKDPAAAVTLLTTFGDLPEAGARAAMQTLNAPIGTFTRTTAHWLQHALQVQGSDAAIELL